MSVETWRYALPNQKGEGWAIIFIDSIGCFTALSDWGNVAYRWPENGWGDFDFRKFLLRCDDSYLTGKFGQNRREYDPEGTLAAVKERIETLTDEDRGLEEKRLLERHSDLYTEYDFHEWYNETTLEDAGEFHSRRIDRDVTNFVKHVMPRLRELLRQDLKL